MSKPTHDETGSIVSPNSTVYLPAVSLPPRFERARRLFKRLFGRHGMVPIPRTYNR